MKSSLTSPIDNRVLTKLKAPTSVDKLAEPLQKDELKKALENLQKTALISDEFSVRETRIIDKPIQGQKYCLCSFIPSSSAKPDKDDVYGMLKIRGTYNTIDECDSASIDIVRNTDSYNKIIYGQVGHPIPITLNDKYDKDCINIDVSEKASSTITENIMNMKKKQNESNTLSGDNCYL